MLDELVLATVISITTNRELFANPLDEPTFYRRFFRQWVVEGMEEAKQRKSVPGEGEV